MNDYKAVRSGLEISQRAASYLELSDPAALRQKTLAGTIYAINDILQGRSEQPVDTLLAYLEQKAAVYYADEIAALRQDIQDFLHQKTLLSQPYHKSSGTAYSFKTFQGTNGHLLKIVDQQMFDAAAEAGFPPDFFRETCFDQVKLYCLPDHADFYGSLFQDCSFTVCRLNAPSFVGARIYSSEFHSCVLTHTDFSSVALVHTHFHDSSLSHVTFQNAYLKSCNTIDCALEHINYLIAKLDGCSFGRVTASHIRHLDTASITQGGATEEECRWNREAIFRALIAEQEAI